VDNPFSLENLRVDQSFFDTGVKKLLTTIPVGRPKSQDFIRVHPNPEYRAQLGVIELQEDREIYLVTNGAMADLVSEASMVMLFTAMNRQGVVRLWPVKLPGPDGKVLESHRSAMEAAESAMKAWCRVKANMNLGAYEIFTAAGAIPEPEWPTLPFTELLSIAFRDRLIASTNHPVVKRLSGL
jgi:hypothetical protein